MAMDKLRGQKPKNVFHRATKPVTTNLKKINIVRDEKSNRLGKSSVGIQKELKQLIFQQCHKNEPVSSGEATRLMAQL
ncbi:hypothetical protein FD754_025275 [Muntiacus muntjak]|uniref:Uncharacterized protein n=1 Tax=Muntiacus muntjak TaxID=9888 RepID=A0A5N3UKW5_MUNMU|nr:hypothetical protein FD754_025276 [Muntiacus muntjak]KAB0337278.1 hypothetical protein FD754_025275 [Muntiacus muntjak]